MHAVTLVVPHFIWSKQLVMFMIGCIMLLNSINNILLCLSDKHRHNLDTETDTFPSLWN